MEGVSNPHLTNKRIRWQSRCIPSTSNYPAAVVRRSAFLQTAISPMRSPTISRVPIRFCCFAVLLLAGQCSNVFAGVITWNVTFEDVSTGTAKGFDDPTLGATRRQIFQDTLDYIDSVLDETGTVDLLVNASQDDGTGFLASAGPYFFSGPAGFYNGFVYDHVRTGSDPTTIVADATLTFDFGYNWNSGLGTPTTGEYDLFTVILHEMTHTLGYLTALDSAGNSTLSGGNPGVYSVFDSFLARGDGTSLFSAGGNFTGTAADLVSDDVFFTGANASAAYGGPVPIYAPSTFQPGSSIGHLDNGVTSVMNFSVAPGTTQRTFEAVDLGILADIGWNLQSAESQSAAVPEPTSALAMAIFGVIAFARKRSRHRAANPA